MNERRPREHKVPVHRRLVWLAAAIWAALPHPGLCQFPFPPSRTEPVVEVDHGVEVPDPYRWLEEQESREVRSWIEAQSRYADFLLAPLAGREEVRRRVSDLMRIEALGPAPARNARAGFRQPADHDRLARFFRQGSAARLEDGRYQVRQIWFRSRDGRRVPIVLVHPRGLRRDGSHPTLLTGSGGPGDGMALSHRPLAVAWLQSGGGVFAFVPPRDGGRLACASPRTAAPAPGQGTFDDFVAAAEWLVREGYTRPSRLAAAGAHDGALTVGVAITRRPDLFRAAVCSSPWLDLVRAHRLLPRDPRHSAPGSTQDARQLRALYAASPYHQVAAGRRYPAVLFLSGDGDAGTSPADARKMTAALQRESSDERPVVLRYHTRAGPRAVEDATDTLSFLLWQLGVAPGEGPARRPGALTLEPYTFRPQSAAVEAVEAELGRLTVPESRRAPSGRTIDLAFVRFRSTAPVPGPPIVFLAGGPGSSGIDEARGPLFPLFMSLRAAGDVVALDQRGTGLSRPALLCRESWLLPSERPADEAEVLRAAVERSRSCAGKLRARGIDLAAYNVQESADDLADLRRALGVPKLSLWSTSYGTQLALTAMRRHERSFARAVLAGVEGPDQTLRSPREVEDQLVEIARLVEADPRAGAAVPDLLGLMRRVLDRLDRQPVAVRLADPIGQATVEIRLGKFDLQWMTAERLTSRDGIRRLPALFRAMDAGDFTALAQFAFRHRKGWLGSAIPYVTQCAAGASEQRLARIRSEAGETLLGGVPSFPFPGICQGWGVAMLGRELRSPVSSRLPVLMISGSLDGRTPPAAAEQVRQGLPNSVHLVLEGAGHGNDLLTSSPSIAQAILGFLRGAAVQPGRIALPPLAFETGPAGGAGSQPARRRP